MPTDFEVLTSSKTNNWNTPVPIIQSARQLMRGIDIDPATNPMAQEWIKASTFYYQHHDGFIKPWRGRLWLNPPYGKISKSLGNYGAGAWFHRAFVEWKRENITEGLVLGKGDSDGFKLLTRECFFVDCDRIAFINADGTPSNKPVPGSRIFYLGTNYSGFFQLFKQYGTILRAIRNVHQMEEKTYVEAMGE